MENYENININLIEEVKRLLKLGSAHNKLYNHDEALLYFQRALEYAIKLNDTKLINELISNIGNMYDIIASKQINPLEYRIKSIEIMRATLPNTPMSSTQISRILNNIGDEYLKAGQYYESLTYFLQSYNNIKNIVPNNHPYIPIIRNNIALVCNSMNSAGNTCLSLTQYKEALKYFSTSFYILQILFPGQNKNTQLIYNNLIKTCSKLHELGKQYLQQKRQKEALSIFVSISDAMLRNSTEPAASLLIDNKI